MSDISWVCLSDTHFGAENSILSHVPEGESRVRPGTPGPVLTQLVECLRALVDAAAGGRPPTLILHGDILELALAEDNVAAMTFAAFIELAYAGPPLFADRVYYVPGNHDHHLWETAREQQFARYIEGLDQAAPIDPPWHVTRLFERPPTVTPEAELLNAVLSRQARRDISVRVVYPNLGIETEDGGRVILIHHGHFTEPLYRLMSTLKTALFPEEAAPVEIWEWESDNFAWIDFFWSTLGRSGSAGVDVGLVYDMLQDRSAVGDLAANLARFVAGQFPKAVRLPARAGLAPLARWLIPKVACRERALPGVVLSEKTSEGTREYLSGPLRLQLERELPGGSDKDVAFVFGHTHKPFELAGPVSGFARPVSLLNSGGWVVDTTTTAAVQGGSVVVIDADGGVASLRMYNQADDPGQYRVKVGGSGTGRDRDLEARLAAVLDLAAPPWSTFSAAAAHAVADRHRLLPVLIDRGKALT